MDVSFDFYDYVLKLTCQIPKGKISTYKELALALGDEISARAVGTALNRNPDSGKNSVPQSNILRRKNWRI